MAERHIVLVDHDISAAGPDVVPSGRVSSPTAHDSAWPAAGPSRYEGVREAGDDVARPAITSPAPDAARRRPVMMIL
jgi:hypothetical protein